MNAFYSKLLCQIAILLLSSFVNEAWTQTVVGPCGSSTLPEVKENTLNYSVQLTLAGATATSWSLTNKVALDAATGGSWGIVSNDYLSLTGGSINAGLSGSSFPVNVSATYNVGGIAHSINGSLSLPIIADTPGPDMIPCIQKFAFVLDASGSMEDDATPGTSKWTRMLDVVDSYWPTLKSAAGLDQFDEWDIILFEGANATQVDAGTFNPANINTNINAIRAAHTIGGSTPMGGGIQRALMSFLNHPDHAWVQQNIILLTDGMQNRNPMVSGDGLQLALDPARGPVGGILGPFPTGPAFPRALAPFNVKIFSIGLGALAVDVETLLRNTSANQYENADSPTLHNMFDTTIPAALESSSPRILDVRHGEMMPYSYKQEAFIVHDSVKSLTLKFVAIDGQMSSAQMFVKKDGDTLDIDPVYQNEQMRLYHFDFPEDSFLIGTPSSKGIWSINFTDFSASKYEATAFVNEENIRTGLDFDSQMDFYAGDELPIRVTLTYQGRPNTEPAEVLALRLKPGEDLGDLMANTYVNKDSIVLSEPDQALGQAKIESLGLRPDILERLKKDSSIITLTYTGNGEYRGVFSGNERTGSYRIISMIKGKHPNLGAYTGWRARSAVFDFSRPDDITLQDSVIDLGLGPNGTHAYRVMTTPVNKFGKKLGPGQENRIKFAVTPGAVDPLLDQLNGTYTARISVPADTKPELSIFVVDTQHPVKQTCLGCFGKPAPVLSVPPDITVACDTSVAVTGMATIENNCASNTRITYFDEVFEDGLLWTYAVKRNWSAIDECGHNLHGVQNIKVNAMPKIKQALTGKPIVLGATTTTLTIDSRSADCIPKWFPAANGKPVGLKSGKQRIDGNCKPGTNPIDANGRLANPLLAEALQLELLVRINKDFGSKKLSSFPCKIHPVVLDALSSSNRDVKELLRVTNLALGNIALAPNLQELYDALYCINEYANICGAPGH